MLTYMREREREREREKEREITYKIAWQGRKSVVIGSEAGSVIDCQLGA